LAKHDQRSRRQQQSESGDDASNGRAKLFRLGTVDPATLNRKLMFGYQGWFLCPQDGSPVNRWIHWFRSQTPVATNAPWISGRHFELMPTNYSPPP
jgi:hypothetical protein